MKEVMNFKREFRSWVKFDPPNMVHLEGLYYNLAGTIRAPIIVMEKMDISFGDYLERHTRSTFPLCKKACFLLQVAEGLSNLGMAIPLPSSMMTESQITSYSTHLHGYLA